MLDAFKHQRGKLYPSWQDNPRLKWERALRELVLGGRYTPVAGVVVVRGALDTYQIFVESRVAKASLQRPKVSRAAEARRSPETFYVKGRTPSFGEIVDALIDIVSEITGEEIMMKQQVTLALNANGAAALRHIRDTAGVAAIDGRTLRSLLDKKLVYDNGPRGIRLTSLGTLALEAYDGQTPEPGKSRRIMFEHEPDPSRRPAEPEPAAVQPPLETTPESDFTPGDSASATSMPETTPPARTGGCRAVRAGGDAVPLNPRGARVIARLVRT
ncbi:MAG: hypothetical protein U0521_28620 [Anaerolineae bacterium]